MITLPTEQKALQALVDRRNPAYNEHLHHWCFCEQTAKGGREWFKQNIHAYLKEGTREYSDRVHRAYRFNHTKEVILLLTKYIFKQGVIRNTTDASSAVQEIWKHANLEGAPIDVFMKGISDLSSATGRVWVVVDNKVSATDVMTVADEKSGRARIYAYLVSQRDMLDYSIDEWGVLNWVMFRIRHRDDADPVTSTGQVNQRFVIWTRDEWIVLEETFKAADETPSTSSSVPVTIVNDPMASGIGNSVLVDALGGSINEYDGREIILVARGENSLGEVPAFCVNHVESSAPYAPPGLVDDIAYLDRAVANYLSNLDAIIQDQTFSQLVIPAQALVPGDDEYGKMTEMGTKRIFVYNNEGGGAGPTYISPEASNATIIMTVIKTIIGEIYHSVGMAGERTKQDNAAGIDNSSGVAKAYDFDRMNALLVSKAAMLQRAENKLIYFTQRWAGDRDQDPNGLQGDTGGVLADEGDTLVKYPDDFDVRGLPDEFDIAQSLVLVEAPDTVRRQQMQSVVDKLFPRLAKDLKAKMQAEMKQWPPDPMDQMQQQLQIQSKFRMGPGSQGGIDSTSAPPGGSDGAAGGSPPEKVPGNKAPGKSKQGQNPGK